MDPHDREDHERYLEAVERMKSSGRKVKTDSDDELTEADFKRLVVAVIICIIGTAAAKGSIFWNIMFFLSLFLAGIWWASDKTDRITRSMMQSYTGKKQELQFQFPTDFDVVGFSQSIRTLHLNVSNEIFHLSAKKDEKEEKKEETKSEEKKEEDEEKKEEL